MAIPASTTGTRVRYRMIVLGAAFDCRTSGCSGTGGASHSPTYVGDPEEAPSTPADGRPEEDECRIDECRIDEGSVPRNVPPTPRSCRDTPGVA